MWYEYKLNYDKADDLSNDADNEGKAGWPTVRDDGPESYNKADYDKDIIVQEHIQQMDVWLGHRSSNAFVLRIMWMLQFRKHKIIDKLEKGPLAAKVLQTFPKELLVAL